MEFKSSQPGFLLTLSRNDDYDPHSVYTIRVQAHTSFGDFTGENDSIHFSAFPVFIKELREFLVSREGEVKLEMTEDCELHFFRWNGIGDVGLRFRVSKYIYFGDSVQALPLSLSGEFPLSGEWLNQMVSELTQLADS